MDIIGIDLSGPSSPERTAVARCVDQSSVLKVTSVTVGADDAELLDCIPEGPCAVGIDAPLSYAPDGGSRTSDQRLRDRVADAGLNPSAVMAPSAPRMAYLTLRGISLTRLFQTTRPQAAPVEVHPAAALVLRGTPPEVVQSLKKSTDDRTSLLNWLEQLGLQGIDPVVADSDHAVAACAAALAAWRWHLDDAAWIHKADPPIHPFDFAC